MIGVIVQARMGSTRLPGKVLMDLNGKPVLQHVLERAAQIRGVDKVVLATNHDLELTNLACALSYDYFALHASNEDDVLTRYYKCADWYGLDTIVRITADCPALNPELSSRVLERFIAGKYDYYSNCRPEGFYPDGWDTEVFSMAVLEDAFRYASSRYDREHVTSYMHRNRLKYRVGRLIQPKNESNIRLTLDTQEDLDRLRRYMVEV